MVEAHKVLPSLIKAGRESLCQGLWDSFASSTPNLMLVIFEVCVQISCLEYVSAYDSDWILWMAEGWLNAAGQSLPAVGILQIWRIFFVRQIDCAYKLHILHIIPYLTVLCMKQSRLLCGSGTQTQLGRHLRTARYICLASAAAAWLLGLFFAITPLSLQPAHG